MLPCPTDRRARAEARQRRQRRCQPMCSAWPVRDRGPGQVGQRGTLEELERRVVAVVPRLVVDVSLCRHLRSPDRAAA